MWSGIDRRRFPRAKFPCKVIIHKNQGIEKYSIETENLSVGGIGVLLDKDLGLFSSVNIELTLDDKNIIKTPAKVVWIVKKTSEGKGSHIFDTGVEFIDLKPDDKKKVEKAVKKIVKNESSLI